MKFSLKAALVVITLVVFGLIFFVEPHLRIKRQNDVISALTSDMDSIERENGNITTIKCTFPVGGDDLPAPIPIERITALYKLKNLSFQSVSFDSLESISKLKHLETLWIEDCKIKDVSSVAELQINHFMLDDEKLASQFPVMPKLERLSLGHAGGGFWLTLTDGNDVFGPPPVGYPFDQLKPYRSVAQLDLLLLTITKFDGLELFPNLKILTLHGCKLLAFDGIEKIPSLQTIDLKLMSPKAPSLSELDLTPLTKCQSLSRLILPESTSDDVLDEIRERVPKCEVVSFESPEN